MTTADPHSTQPEAIATCGSSAFGFHANLGRTDVNATVEHVTAVRKTEGFCVLSDIDVLETMKARPGLDVSAHCIPGACNPALAHRALSVEPDIGLLLPCSVAVRQEADGLVTVGFMNPLAMLSMTDNAEVAKVAHESRATAAGLRHTCLSGA